MIPGCRPHKAGVAQRQHPVRYRGLADFVGVCMLDDHAFYLFVDIEHLVDREPSGITGLAATWHPTERKNSSGTATPLESAHCRQFVFSTGKGCLQRSHNLRAKRWATIQSSELPTRKGSTPISMSRFGVVDASLVWIVESTR